MAKAFLTQIYILVLFLPALSLLLLMGFYYNYCPNPYPNAGFLVQDVMNDVRPFMPRNVSISRASNNSQLNLTIDTATPEDTVNLSQYEERLDEWVENLSLPLQFNFSNLTSSSDLPLYTNTGFTQITSKNNFTFTFYGNSNVTGLEGINISYNVTSLFGASKSVDSKDGNLSVDIYFDDGISLWHIYGNVDPTYHNTVELNYGWMSFGPKVIFEIGNVDGYDYSFKVSSQNDPNTDGQIHFNVQVDPNRFLAAYFPAEIESKEGNVYKAAPGIVVAEG